MDVNNARALATALRLIRFALSDNLIAFGDRRISLGVVGGLGFNPFPIASVLNEVSSAAPTIYRLDLLDIKYAVCVHVPAEDDFKVVVCRSGQLEVDFYIADIRPAWVDHQIGGNLRIRKLRHWLRWYVYYPRRCNASCGYDKQ